MDSLEYNTAIGNNMMDKDDLVLQSPEVPNCEGRFLDPYKVCTGPTHINTNIGV